MAAIQVYVPVCVSFRDGSPVEACPDCDGAPWPYSSGGRGAVWEPETEEWRDATEAELSAADAYVQRRCEVAA